MTSSVFHSVVHISLIFHVFTHFNIFLVFFLLKYFSSLKLVCPRSMYECWKLHSGAQVFQKKGRFAAFALINLLLSFYLVKRISLTFSICIHNCLFYLQGALIIFIFICFSCFFSSDPWPTSTHNTHTCNHFKINK